MSLSFAVSPIHNFVTVTKNIFNQPDDPEKGCKMSCFLYSVVYKTE